MIVIVDFGQGNPGSLHNMLMRIEAKSRISSDSDVIESADHLILPGVGAFDTAVGQLRMNGAVDYLAHVVMDRHIPILGICLGMQVFTRKSEEGECKGLGWLDADTVKFRNSQNSSFKIPHMSWNTVEKCKECPLFDAMEPDAEFYFTHSYHLIVDDLGIVAGTTRYGYDFPSVIQKNNIYGVQFHPEKSHKYGMKMLQNFLELT